MDQKQAGPLIYEESPRWVRVRVGGETVADSKQPLLAWESGKVVPFYLFPPAAVRSDLLSDAGTDDGKRFYDLPEAPRAAWSYVRAGDLDGVLIQTEELSTDVVQVGSVVHVKDEKTGKSVKYTIVGSAEAKPQEHKLSNESPVGRALLGRRRNETVAVKVPRGPARKLKITKIDVGLK